MAAPTIDRTNYNALVDDDGSDTVGTNWSKNQVKTVLLDPIDTLAAQLAVTTNTWTPNDASGANLVFSTALGLYAIWGSVVLVVGDVTYPATANGAGAKIGGFPFSAMSGVSSWHMAVGYCTVGYLPGTQLIGSSMFIHNPTTMVVLTNAQMSSVTIRFTGIYRNA